MTGLALGDSCDTQRLRPTATGRVQLALQQRIVHPFAFQPSRFTSDHERLLQN